MLELFKKLGGLLSGLLSFGEQIAENKSQKIPHQVEAIKEKAETKVERHEVKQDKIQDRKIRTEPKQLCEFNADQETEFLKQSGGKWVLYSGDRNEVLKRIKRDEGNVLTNEQERQLRKDVKDSRCKWFIIRVHPLTIHGND